MTLSPEVIPIRRQGGTEMPKQQSDQKGSIVVEASIALVIFIGIMAFMINLTNVYIVHDRVQYALTQTVKELSTYSYLYSASGLQEKHDSFIEKAETEAKSVNDSAKDLNTLWDSVDALAGAFGDAKSDLTGGDLDFDELQGDLDNLINAGDEAVDDAIQAGSSIISLAKDPKQTAIAFLYLGAQGALEYGKSKLILAPLASALAPKYLSDGSGRDANEFLKAYGVKGGWSSMDFGESRLFYDGKTIDLIVEYDISVQFPLLPLPFDSFHIVQRAAAAAWLDGDGSDAP